MHLNENTLVTDITPATPTTLTDAMGTLCHGPYLPSTQRAWLLREHSA